MADNLLKVKNAIVPIIQALKRQRETRLRIRGKIVSKTTPSKPIARPPQYKAPAKPVIKSKSEIIGIGISTGGPNALTKMIPMLPADFSAPILIVQHMPPMFTSSLANSLNAKAKLEVKEAENGDVIAPGKILLIIGIS